jgi:hypothetical protein
MLFDILESRTATQYYQQGRTGIIKEGKIGNAKVGWRVL